MERKRIVIIGSGNVATHLARAFDDTPQVRVVQVMSRDIDHARDLAQSLHDVAYTDDFARLITDAHYYVISVSDDQVAHVAARMPRVQGVVMHTSGSVPMESIRDVSPRFGVLYPLQTFSKTAHVQMDEVPFFLEASSPGVLADIEALAQTISSHIYYADSKQRTTLHIAAVFGCNFVNHLLAISDDILRADGYSLEVLYPLLRLTLDKAMSMPPRMAQTGPAARGDVDVISRHISALDPRRAEIYRLLSQSIIDTKSLSHNKC